MLKKLLIVLCVSSSFAQEAKKLPPLEPEYITTQAQCFDSDILFRELRKTYNEVPFLVGKADDQVESVMSLWVNIKDKSWTIVASKSSLSCVIGFGSEIKLISKGKHI
jgi:hypothetical protein